MIRVIIALMLISGCKSFIKSYERLFTGYKGVNYRRMCMDAFEDRGKELRKHYLPSSVAPTVEDRRCIEERHLDHRVTGMYAVDSSRCKHGVPRAFMQFPVAGRISSGMIRLTCPYLVKAIDEWEADGAIESFNSLLEGRGDLRDNFDATNKAHAQLRSASVTPLEREVIDRKLGKEGAAHLMGSGIIGISLGRNRDVKCLHAHTADFLLRGDNDIGRLALQGLESERGVDPNGCDSCFQQCNLQTRREDADWWYVPAKNKQRLRQKKNRRREFKAFIRGKRQREKDERREENREDWGATHVLPSPSQL